jgi:biofilm PGA synthesis lipoprotein PgaB
MGRVPDQAILSVNMSERASKTRLIPALAIAAAAFASVASAPGPPGVPPPRAAASRATPDRAHTAQPLIAILCYHHVSSESSTKLEVVSPEFLRRQIRECRQSGWSFMSLAELLAHRDHPESLPPKTMVLTFDDGYRSFIESALPILREEKVPTTLAVITSFVDHPPPEIPPLMSWAQIRAAAAQGVEIASHSHDLHRYETSNPYRDTYPSTGARRYLLKEARYENREEYRARIRADLFESQRVLKERLGREASVLVWPYGEHNEMSRGIATQAGFTTMLALGWREVSAADLQSGCLPRIMVTHNMDFTHGSITWLRPPPKPIRAARVDLDAIFDPDPAVYARHLDAMVARVKSLGVTHVFLQACPDPARDGRFAKTWFMNHQIPVRADVWSMVAARLAQARIKVWIRSPSMNLAWIWEQHPEWRIPFDRPRNSKEPTPWYFRVSPDLPEAHRKAIDFYTDLAVYLPISGVLFDDDAFMLPGERLNTSHSAAPADKEAAIDSLLGDVAAAVRAWRPECKFGRVVHAPVVERNGIDPSTSQDFARVLSANDLTVVVIDPRAQGHARDAARWTGDLARRARARWKPAPGHEGDPAPEIFQLEAYDAGAGRPVSAKELAAEAAAARKSGIASLGVFPIDLDRSEIPDRLLEGLPPESLAVGSERH